MIVSVQQGPKRNNTISSKQRRHGLDPPGRRDAQHGSSRASY
jgi:hypothetical protein